jgi:hypothetical protein
MKFLLIVCGLIVALGGIFASCGPQKAYCPSGPNGECADNSLGGSTGSGGDTGPGDATIITGSGGQ